MDYLTPLSLPDFSRALEMLGVVVWFLDYSGLFFGAPFIFTTGPCALGFSFSSPPQNTEPTHMKRISVNLDRVFNDLLMLTVVRERMGAYADLGFGLQIAVWDWHYLDPKRKCWTICRQTLKSCLNALAPRKAAKISKARSRSPSPSPTPSG